MPTGAPAVGLRAPVTLPHVPLTLFWSGAVAIMAMILPGLSGSFLLLVLGQSQHVMEALKGPDLATLVPFALGCAVVLAAFVRLLRWLLERWHGQTVPLLAALVLAAFGVLVVVGLEWQQQRAGLAERGG